MTLNGQSYIAGVWQHNQHSEIFNGFCPGTNESLPSIFYEATLEQVNQATASAELAFKAYRRVSEHQRARFLNTIADEIAALGDVLIETTMLETNLPRQRLEGERLRSINQLRAFADVLLQELEPLQLKCVDDSDETRLPIAKPRTALTHIPIGVVAVFGASNFPYAFSTLGGDTAAALAAGCPVIVKAHPAHPATNELMTKAIDGAIKQCGIPNGVFSMLQGRQHQLSHQLVRAPSVKAVGFTGSLSAATALLKTINDRKEPIPLYGELGSVNPQIVLKGQDVPQKVALAKQLVNSMSMGHGQFCTSPGVWFVPAEDIDFESSAVNAIESAPSDTLLTPGILHAFIKRTDALFKDPNTTLLAKGKLSKQYHAAVQLYTCSADDFAQSKQLQEEVFGPCAILVKYQDEAALMRAISALDGQLTASVYGKIDDFHIQEELIESLQYKVGRLIYNQAPTGVEVCMSMNHGGPFPSSTDVKSTSVGTRAILRFLRPLCVQGDI
ncbi:aldehyde dehydrogenase (NADP(+)) [Pseudoalteromonas luteoviolacea]|uniref:Aldehyde dehydrogenase domain-containing protein n=1 Tax=Pseudoalteromonas luteoviolacea S4054 TaxID=1129367 RepID=A0A0F6A7R5_9GAMM|nr:aldehyde dehydrogenase (NADP(+)) [Pseudoalteromonas luteoviolacea]AOT07792.1 aldehyde dehydrogenase [Pseudoalteromonas luteoviolacea]AOT12708.1 aldehyde dehydrogenase [Pseudoalteromonas luteoviolacea]AOT17621.1 aldehyde dehydrogenase [Pseudoalteromonas luteoviolacea]KKE82277.1 hypothetical protein N479_18740 [Pseudoalteromonas luteoviolacea S4054]KZN78929.1 hypothetical protein N481_00370 [Pseudoalteromonas luteoviolacea S4047-1]